MRASFVVKEQDTSPQRLQEHKEKGLLRRGDYQRPQKSPLNRKELTLSDHQRHYSSSLGQENRVFSAHLSDSVSDWETSVSCSFVLFASLWCRNLHPASRLRILTVFVIFFRVRTGDFVSLSKLAA